MPMAPEPITSSDFGMPVRHHGLEIGPDQLLVGLEPGQHARPRAGGDDDVLGLIAPGAERALRALRSRPDFTVILPGASIAASPQITVTLFFFIRKPTPSLRRFDTRARALHHRVRVVADVVAVSP